MENISKKLESLGLTGKEAEVYTAILKIKKATVAKLADATGIKRTTIYHCLDDLIAKNLITKAVVDNKKYYFAESPKDSLNNLVEDKKRIVEAITPELQVFFGAETFQPEIKIYHNASGIRELFEDVLTSQEKKARYYVSDFGVEELLGETFVRSFVKRRIALGITSYTLRSARYKPEREEISEFKSLREIRYIPENISIKPYMCIYDNKVAFISAKEEKMGFIVYSKDFAEMQKTLFDVLWKNSGSGNGEESEEENYWSIKQ